MSHTIRSLASLVWILALIVPGGLVPATETLARIAPDAPADLPTAVMHGKLDEWALGSGLLYWARRCPGGSERWAGDLKRMPANGGVETTLSFVEASKCYTFLNMAADEDGIYYFSADEGGIFHRPVGSPFDPHTLIWTTTQPLGPVVPSGEYLYWPSSDNRILRVRKDGTDLQTIAHTSPYPRDLAVVGDNVYWLDSGGLWTTDQSCGSLPCAKKRLTTTGERTKHLLYVPQHGYTVFELYWVEYLLVGEDSWLQKIRRFGCQQLPGWPTAKCGNTDIRYAPGVDWNIGQLAIGSYDIFWPESSAVSNQGLLKRKPIDGSEIVTIADGWPHIDYRVFTDSRFVYFSERDDPDPGIWRLPLCKSAFLPVIWLSTP